MSTRVLPLPQESLLQLLLPLKRLLPDNHKTPSLQTLYLVLFHIPNDTFFTSDRDLESRRTPLTILSKFIHPLPLPQTLDPQRPPYPTVTLTERLLPILPTHRPRNEWDGDYRRVEHGRGREPGIKMEDLLLRQVEQISMLEEKGAPKIKRGNVNNDKLYDILHTHAHTHTEGVI